MQTFRKRRCAYQIAICDREGRDGVIKERADVRERVLVLYPNRLRDTLKFHDVSEQRLVRKLLLGGWCDGCEALVCMVVEVY